MKMDPKQTAFVMEMSTFAQRVAIRSGLSPDIIIGGLGIVLAGALGGLAVVAPEQHNERAKLLLNRLPGWIEAARREAVGEAATRMDATEATQH